ncbi:hypothetical protein B0H14DRAFT_2330152, partial [Mycena olivaceomarginata]
PQYRVLPDFASEEFADIRNTINANDQTAIDSLVAAWTKANDKRKKQWEEQVAADKAAEKSCRGSTPEGGRGGGAEAAKIAEKERLEEEAKKPKLGDFNANGDAPSALETRISPFAQRKLEKREYCLLWPFTPKGLAEAASTALSSNDDISSVRLTQTEDNQLSVQAGPSSSAHKNMVRDDQLTWREFELGQSRFTKEIIRANWPKPHVDAITHFFYLICNHSLREQPQGDLTLQTYADRTRYEWHLTLGTPQSFNIAQINEGLLAKIGDELFQ